MIAAMPKTRSSARHGGAFETSPFRGFSEVSIAPLQPQSPTNQPVLETGTAVAISYPTLGVAAHLPSNTGRGGARNRADRVSHSLTAAQIANLSAAARHAAAIGLPLNRMITIHWATASVPLASIPRATGRYIELITKALARHRNKTAWVFVHENGERKGGHCHLLAHVPAEHVKRLTGLQKRWLCSITGLKYRATMIHSRPIGRRLGLEKSNPNLHAINAEATLAYILKGASPDAAHRFGLERLEPGGRIIGKRCGTSQNIGAKARKSKD